MTLPNVARCVHNTDSRLFAIVGSHWLQLTLFGESLNFNYESLLLHITEPLKNKFGATSEPPTILETPSVDSSPLNTQSLTTQLPTTVQATQETTMLYTEGVTTQGVATQAMPGVTTQAMQGATAQKVGGELSLKENVRGNNY